MNASDPLQSQRFSIVIPTKNGGSLFASVIDGLRRQSVWGNSELVVVDSGSTDETPDIARRAGARVIEIPQNEFNHGATRDYGISLTSHDIVVLMVQDAVPYDANLLGALLQSFSDPETAGVYARQIPRPDADMLTKRNLDNWLTGRLVPEQKQIKSLQWYEALSPMEKYYFCNFDNVCSAIRKSVWQQHAFGRINFGEDINWSERVLKAGLKIMYQPEAAVIHSHDRPVSYEYKRTYVCHRNLYRQFGIHIVPTLSEMWKFWKDAKEQDCRYVFAQHDSFFPALKLLLKSFVVNFLNLYAQYRAVRDESSGRTHSIKDV